MKSSLDLCPRDLHIVFGKNRAWQWQCLWPESALLCVPLSPKVIFVILYLHKLPRECASHAQSWFSALFLTKRAGVAQTASLFYMPFQGEFTSKAFAALIARIRSASTFLIYQVLLVFIVLFLVLNVILSADLAWLGQRTANLWYPSPWLGSYLIFPCSHFSKHIL